MEHAHNLSWTGFRPTKQQWLILAGFFAVYILTIHISRWIFFSFPGSPAVILSPAGIALAGLILYGYKFWPAIAIASIVNGLINGSSPLLLLIGTFGTVAQALFGYYILHKFRFRPQINRLRDMMALIVVALIATPVGPLFMQLGRWMTGTKGSTTWNLIWLGSVLSVIVLTAFFVRWLSSPEQFKRIRSQLPETIVVFLLYVGVNFVIFWTPYAQIRGVSLAILQLALLAWIALRMGTSRTTLAFLIMTSISLSGPYFGMVRPAATEFTKKIISTELYIIIFAVLFYIISAIYEERETVMTMLKKNIGDLGEAIKRIKMEDQKKTEFISVLAHELRNPLAPIVNYLEIMNLDGAHKSKFNDAITGIERQVKNMTRLLEDLLDVSRISQEKVQLQKEKIDTRTIIERAVESTRALVNDKNHSLSVRLPDKPVLAFADPVRVEQIIINLLNNAVRYTDPGGSISISCEIKDKNIVITVRDNGIGISTETLPIIFEMFSQGDPSITRAHQGLGIGLKLAKALTELHGGTINVESDGAGKGSTFTICIPKYEGNGNSNYNPALKKSTQPTVLSPKVTKKVLVVDDNVDTVHSLTKLLNFLGYETLSAYDGIGAIKNVRDHSPDAVLLDISLPGMSGYEIAQKLRNEMNYSSPLIAISGYGQKDDKVKAYEAGFNHHLTKPVGVADIQKLI